MTAIDKLITEAKRWTGYLEKANNSQLDSFKANAGNRNYTRFATDYCGYFGENINIYQAQPWCAMYVSVVFANAFGAENAEKLLYGHYAYCPYGVRHFKNNNAWYTVPQVGDIIFFSSETRASHTGIVISVDDGRVYTAEGNTSSTGGVVANGGCVAQKSYSLEYSKILGYGRPHWSILSKHWSEPYKVRLENANIISDDLFWIEYDNPAPKSQVIALIDKATGGIWQSDEADPRVHWVQPNVISLCGKGIITDQSSWLTNPDASISKGLMLALVDNSTGGMKPDYTDRISDHWARNHLDSLCDKDIIASPSEWTDFDGEVSSGSVMALICKAFGI